MQFPLNKSRTHTHIKQENTHIKMRRKGWDTLTINPTSGSLSHNWEGIILPVFLWAVKGLEPTSSTPAVRLTPDGWAAETPGSESQWDVHCERKIPQTLSVNEECWSRQDCYCRCPPLPVETSLQPGLCSLRGLRLWKDRTLYKNITFLLSKALPPSIF